MTYTKYHSPAYSLDDLLNKAEQDNNELALAIADRSANVVAEAYETGWKAGYEDGFFQGHAAVTTEGEID